MRNSSNVITLKDRQQSCETCRFQRDCLAKTDSKKQRQIKQSSAISGCVVRRGAHIFRMGDPFDCVYMVRSGAVKTYWLAADGDQQVTGFYLPGEVFGLCSVSSESYVNSAVALDTSGICTLPYDHLQRLCLSSEDNLARLMARLSSRIRESEEAFIVLGHKSADERMAWFLIDISRRQARLGLCPNEINLPMTRTDIGSYLMLAVETVSRVLTRLQAKGLIEVRRNRVVIKSPERLRSLAESSAGSAASEARRQQPSPYWGDCRDLTCSPRPTAH
ncbi:MAG TPA: helix-turn-helix domain-containing protein [Gammaproteobacteria bacterium]|nr:helix-turn-helix domain-containing protein [Gammaproteobacteria bacterium]